MNTGGGSPGKEIIDLRLVPDGVREILGRLERNGYTAYLVGGVVRDIVMGRQPKDYDIATSAAPARVRELFPKVVPTGEKHGTVTVFVDGLGVEVTTLRREGRYTDYRRPDSVRFTGSLKEDLSRRDFTINSLAAGPGGVVYDFFGGLRDIAGGVIRTVGNPKKRFREDALRMLRAVRFSCQTGFAIEERTLESIGINRRLIAAVSAERIREELNAILVSDLPHRGVQLIYHRGLMEYILPELADWFQAGEEAGRGDVYSKTLDFLRRTPARLNVRLAALFGGLTAPCQAAGEGIRRGPGGDSPGDATQAGDIMERLKYDRRTVKSVMALVMNYRRGIIRDRKELKRVIGSMGPENFRDLTDLLGAGAGSSGMPGGEEAVERIRETAKEIVSNNEPCMLKDLALNGNDLKMLGIRPGREMGGILNGLFEIVLENPAMNQKGVLLDLARRWMK